MTTSVLRKDVHFKYTTLPFFDDGEIGECILPHLKKLLLDLDTVRLTGRDRRNTHSSWGVTMVQLRRALKEVKAGARSALLKYYTHRTSGLKPTSAAID